MGDQHNGDAKIAIQVAEQIVKIRLLGGINAGGGLIQEEQLWIGD